MFDYHVHTHTSFDADPAVTVEAQCEAAIRGGLRELAVTNHYELDLVENGTLPPTDFAPEEEELLQARARFGGRLTVLRGIELGQPCYDLQKAEALLRARPYDVVLCSQHYLTDGTDFYCLHYDGFTETELKTFWETYLQELLRVAREAPADVLTHPCYPLRYFPRDSLAFVTGGLERLKEQFEPILQALIGREIALEINTSCMRKHARFPEPDPGLALLTLYRELGGKYLTAGSDAHRPQEVGANLRDACMLAKNAGFDSLTAFRNREKHPIKIDEVLL